MVPHEACSRGDRFAVDAGKALDKDEMEEERVCLLAARDQEMLGAEKVDEADSGEEGVDGAGVDITFLTAPLPGLSIRLISRWKVLILARVKLNVGGRFGINSPCGVVEL